MIEDNVKLVMFSWWKMECLILVRSTLVQAFGCVYVCLIVLLLFIQHSQTAQHQWQHISPIECDITDETSYQNANKLNVIYEYIYLNGYKPIMFY